MEELAHRLPCVPSKHVATPPAHQVLNLPTGKFRSISSLHLGYSSLQKKARIGQDWTFTGHNMDGQSQRRKPK